MGVIIIIAVFWLLGLLMAWSMCVVAARADRHMEEIRNAGDGRNNERTLPAENHRGGAASSASSSSHSRGGARAEAGSINRKGGVTC